MEVSAVTGGELACRARSEGVCGRSVIEWLLPSPARARRACPLPGQGEGSGNGNLRRKQKIHRLVECTHETLGLTEMPNLSIRDLESLNDCVIVAARGSHRKNRALFWSLNDCQTFCKETRRWLISSLLAAVTAATCVTRSPRRQWIHIIVIVRFVARSTARSSSLCRFFRDPGSSSTSSRTSAPTVRPRRCIGISARSADVR